MSEPLIPLDRHALIVEIERLRAALSALLAESHGCVFCDSGKLRNQAKPHEPDCGFALAERALTPNAQAHGSIAEGKASRGARS